MTIAQMTEPVSVLLVATVTKGPIPETSSMYLFLVPHNLKLINIISYKKEGKKKK